MKNDRGILINNPVEFNLSGGNSINPFISSEKCYDVEIDWLEDGEYPFFPSIQCLYYYPKCGKIVMCVDDQVYAILYKDNATSDISRTVPEDLVQENENGEDI